MEQFNKIIQLRQELRSPALMKFVNFSWNHLNDVNIFKQVNLMLEFLTLTT